MENSTDYLSRLDDTTRQLIRMALEEDRVREDHTTHWSIPENTSARARLVSKQTGIFCGGPLFAAVFQELDPETRVEFGVAEGEEIRAGQVAGEISGNAYTLLGGERTALNLLGRLSGIATQTAAFVNAIGGTSARICDTRKTTPLWRQWEKYAVRQGGGTNHRMNLSDQVLLKDNHISLSKNIVEAYRSVKEKNLIGIPVEVEVDTLDQLRDLLTAGVERVLLDNMSLEELREAVKITAGRAILEASGGVSLETVRAIAETGVDFISVGALTHSVPNFDFSLETEILFDDDLDKPNPAVM